MRLIASIIVVLLSFSAFAQKVKSISATVDLIDLIEDYSKNTGKGFILGADVRGKVTIVNPKKLNPEELFKQISIALSLHGYSINELDQVLIVQPSRTAQRSLIEVSTELPTLSPERMATWIITLKHITSSDVLNQLRNATTRDGEITAFNGTNQLILTDYTSNLHRFAMILKNLDRAADPQLSKLIEQNLKKEEQSRLEKSMTPKSKE